MRACVMILSTNLPDDLVGEDILNATWLRNRLSRAIIDFEIPLLSCTGMR